MSRAASFDFSFLTLIWIDPMNKPTTCLSRSFHVISTTRLVDHVSKLLDPYLSWLSQGHPFEGLLQYPQPALIPLTLFCDPFIVIDCPRETFRWSLPRAVSVPIAP
jgi:hypothetical protein